MVKLVSMGKRMAMATGERTARSKLAQLIGDAGILRGSVVVRERKCGKSNCKCVRGEKHVGKYLVMSDGGKKRQLFIPDDMEARVRRWIDNYRQAQESLEEICNINWEKIAKREK
jgi:hypothetical protein